MGNLWIVPVLQSVRDMKFHSDCYEETDILRYETVRIAIALLTFWSQEGLPNRRYVWVGFSCRDVMFKDYEVLIAITVNVKR
jgi:hypothetical protein